ncbi:unnamed protein product [Rangifer tarandus platyrhynchus]|uniref:Uncharacterized protein n=1 Tax=Rangifer tarandus platyrhynchus TaxID=3082113 RepID=A0ACB1KDU2_RANTA
MSRTQPPRLEGGRSRAGLPRPRPLGRGKDGRRSVPHVETSPPPPARTRSFLALRPSFPPWKPAAFGRGVAFGGAGRRGRAQGGQRANGCPRKPARSRGVQGPRQAPSSGRSSSAHASRRVGPAPAARPPLLPGAPGLRPAQAVPLRPRKRRCPCAPGAREPPESGSPPAPHTPAPTPKHSGPAGPVAAIGPSGPVGTPSHSASAKSSVFSSTSTFRWGWLSALPGRPPGGTGSSSKAGAGVCPAPSWPQPPREGPGTRRSRKKCS